jgi:hypothetical protein
VQTRDYKGFFDWGTEYWLGLSVYLVDWDDSPASWNTLVQTHTYPGNGNWDCISGDNGFTLWTKGADNTLRFHAQVVSDPEVIPSTSAIGPTAWQGTVESNRWYDLVVHFKFSTGSDGFIETWLDGQKIVDMNGPNVHRRDCCGVPREPICYLKIGSYKQYSHTAVRSVYFDEVRIGDSSSSYAEVAPNEAVFFWHNDHKYANFTIDDPIFSSSDLPWYETLLESANNHNCHITIAFPPRYGHKNPDGDIVNIFKNNPNRLSVTIHGNNHDGHEFYSYDTPTPNYDEELLLRTYAEQEADIVEGLSRMEEFGATTGLSWGKVMVFPHNICPVSTLGLLKRYNFNGTSNSFNRPLKDEANGELDASLVRVPIGPAHPYDMFKTRMCYRNFPVNQRYAASSDPNKLDSYVEQIKNNRVVILYCHRHNVDNLWPIADRINSEFGDEVEWRSLDYIFKHMYLQKLNDDGSWDAKIIGNNVIITNESDSARTCHVTKPEELPNIPVVSVKVNGISTAYTVENDILSFDMNIPANDEREILISYTNIGDVTGDGLVDTLDIQACVNHILQIQTWAGADVNRDTRVDVRDIQAVVSILLSG